MKKLCFLPAVLLLALSCLVGCRKKEDPVQIIEQAEASLPPVEQMPPQTVDAKGAPAADSASLDAAASQLAYEAWFKKYALDLNDPKMLDADPDGDGVSNRDEFMADSDPLSANSRPGVHSQMRLKDYTEVRLPVVLEAVEGDAARIKRLDGEERTEKVKVGQTIKGLRWKVDRIEAKQDTDKRGERIDISTLTLTDVDTKEHTMLMKDLPTRTGDSFAELTSADGQQTMKVKQDQVFTWPDKNGATFKVVDLRADQVVVQEVETRKMWTIPKQ